MSIREDIASNIKTVIDAISSPDIRLCTRQPFELEELSQAQYPAVLIQTSEELREDAEIGSGARTRMGTIDFVVLGFVKGSNTNIDTLRNALITAIETALETDITRDSNALDTEVVQVETDEGTLFPVGGIRMVVRE
jgi:hypothetical protein